MSVGLTVEALLASLLATEGGYTNNPNDPGGETNYGITVAVARTHDYQGPMKAMTRADAMSIYRAQYFTVPGFDKLFAISPGIGAELFDTGVNMGVEVAATMLQRSLNALNHNGSDYPDLTPDGHCGPATRAALQAYVARRGHEGESVMLKALNCLQGARYISLAEANPKLEAFVYGWLDNRVSLSL